MSFRGRTQAARPDARKSRHAEPIVCGGRRAAAVRRSGAVTIAEFFLAAPGTTSWGPTQRTNDPDGAVDHDERLTMRDVAPEGYDLRMVDKPGRVGVVRDVEVKSGAPYAFSISESKLKDWNK